MWNIFVSSQDYDAVNKTMGLRWSLIDSATVLIIYRKHCQRAENPLSVCWALAANVSNTG